MTKVFLIGNLTRDPELTETAGGVSVCRFAVAVNRGFGENRATDFYNVTAWRRLGEQVAQYTKKGNKIAAGIVRGTADYQPGVIGRALRWTSLRRTWNSSRPNSRMTAVSMTPPRHSRARLPQKRSPLLKPSTTTGISPSDRSATIL